MKKIVAAISALVAVTGSALAADLPARPYTKAPPPAVAVANWSGFYVGGAAGWARTEVTGDYVTTPNLNHHNATGDSLIVSGIAGFQYQWNQLVLGIEGDYSGLTLDNKWPAVNAGANASCVQQLAPLAISCRGRIDELWTVGARIGFTPASQWLLYGTGGYASAKLDTSVFNRGTGLEIGRSGLRHDGWYAGAGVDYALTSNWILGFEYRHVELDTRRHFDDYFGGCCIVTPETRDMKGKLDIVRARLTYKFGWPGAAVVAKY
ncbi:outer membrane beta-barrel protein [Bradyrhizobium sp.]|uniref:outer membrane protein n=1 Tax=Bradyrhizobium sp. TaxID=376 RepID=UPI001DA1A438|nr:outer membrane beta-barrel protein [Bradyrhizobium sp.]MBI5319409.1 porin family protein [Bradyrhizobium sp.]